MPQDLLPLSCLWGGMEQWVGVAATLAGFAIFSGAHLGLAGLPGPPGKAWGALINVRWEPRGGVPCLPQALAPQLMMELSGPHVRLSPARRGAKGTGSAVFR